MSRKAEPGREEIAAFLMALKKLQAGLDDFNCQLASIDGGAAASLGSIARASQKLNAIASSAGSRFKKLIRPTFYCRGARRPVATGKDEKETEMTKTLLTIAATAVRIAQTRLMYLT